MIVSMASTVADRGRSRRARRRRGQLWFQLYIQPDLDFTEASSGGPRRPAAGRWWSRVDSPVFGRRERDLRNGFHRPAGRDVLREPARAGGRQRSAADRHVARSSPGSTSTGCARSTALPIVLKGVAAPGRRAARASSTASTGSSCRTTAAASSTRVPADDRAAAGDRRGGRRARARAARRRRPARHRRRQGAGARRDRRRRRPAGALGAGRRTARRASRGCSRCCARSSSARSRCAAAARPAT